MLVEQTIAQRSDVENQYRRVVPDEGNPLAQAAMADVFRLDGDSEWRGLGVISATRRAAYASLSALRCRGRIFARAPQRVCDDLRARCGEVLTGRCKPHQCPPSPSTRNSQKRLWRANESLSEGPAPPGINIAVRKMKYEKRPVSPR